MWLKLGQSDDCEEIKQMCTFQCGRFYFVTVFAKYVHNHYDISYKLSQLLEFALLQKVKEITNTRHIPTQRGG